MDKFPREIQNELLTSLYEVFPYSLEEEKCMFILNKFGDDNNIIANLKYLIDHRLISENSIYQTSDGYHVNDSALIITTKGIDFIRDDGGLSSILNVTTIKIHNETLEKLEDIIKQSSLTETEKKTYLGKLKELPVDATKHLVLKLLDLGLSRASDVTQLISSYFQSW